SRAGSIGQCVGACQVNLAVKRSNRMPCRACASQPSIYTFRCKPASIRPAMLNPVIDRFQLSFRKNRRIYRQGAHRNEYQRGVARLRMGYRQDGRGAPIAVLANRIRQPDDRELDNLAPSHCFGGTLLNRLYPPDQAREFHGNSSLAIRCSTDHIRASSPLTQNLLSQLISGLFAIKGAMASAA